MDPGRRPKATGLDAIAAGRRRNVNGMLGPTKRPVLPIPRQEGGRLRPTIPRTTREARTASSGMVGGTGATGPRGLPEKADKRSGVPREHRGQRGGKRRPTQTRRGLRMDRRAEVLGPPAGERQPRRRPATAAGTKTLARRAGAAPEPPDRLGDRLVGDAKLDSDRMIAPALQSQVSRPRRRAPGRTTGDGRNDRSRGPRHAGRDHRGTGREPGPDRTGRARTARPDRRLQKPDADAAPSRGARPGPALKPHTMRQPTPAAVGVRFHVPLLPRSPQPGV